MINKVLRNTLAMFSGQSGAHAIALLFNIFLAKYFSKELYPPLLIALIFSPIVWFLRPHLSFWISGPIYASLCLAAFLTAKTIKWSDLKLFSYE